MIKTLLISILCVPGFIFSQQIKVSGNIQTEQNQNIPYASVIFKGKDAESLYKGVLTDENGIFNIDLKRENYTVEISVVGVQATSYNLDLREAVESYNAGIYKINTTVLLEGVVVKGEEELIQILHDKKVYNVAKDRAARGASLTNVIENLPSVQVDNGSIAIRGDNNVTLLVDGQPNGLTKSLETFPSSMVETIEVITSPGARYQAQGTAGIINIVLKKGKESEYNSSTEFFTAYPLTAGVNGNISQVGGKGNWYLNAGTGYSEPVWRNYISLETPQNVIQETKQITERERKRKYFLVNLGGSRKFKKEGQLNASITARRAVSDNENTVNYDDLIDDGSIEKSRRTEIEDEDAMRYQTNISYKQNFGEKVIFKTHINGEISEVDKSSNINTELFFPNNKSNFPNTTEKEEYQKSLGFSADYENEKNEKINFSTGYRKDYVQIGSDVEVNQIEDVIVAVDEFNNNVRYTETIDAGYIEVKLNNEKENWTLGLRGENTKIDVQDNKGGYKQNKNYFNLFPSIRYVKQISEKKRLQIALYRRIERAPRSTRWILPYSTFTDNRNMFVGNPDIDPTFLTGIEVELVLRPSKKLSLYPTLFYKKEKDEMELYIEKRIIRFGEEEQDVYTSSLVNIGDYHSYGLDLAYRFRPSKKWRFNGDVMLFGFRQIGSYKGVSFNGENIMFMGRFILTHYISKTLDFQVRNYYTGPARSGQYNLKGRYRTNMDIRKEIFKGKGRILLGVQDVFNSNFRRVKTEATDYTRLLELQTRVPQIDLSITYRFNQKKYKGIKGNQFDDSNF